MNLAEDRSVTSVYRVVRDEIRALIIDHGTTFSSVTELLHALDERMTGHYVDMVVTDEVDAPSVPEEGVVPTKVEHLENGIFNMVVTLVMLQTQVSTPTQARGRVIEFLAHLIAGLSDEPSTEGEPT